MDSTAAATISAEGAVVIPKELREKYGLTPGRSVEVIDYGGNISIILAPDDPIKALHGMFASVGGESWTEALLEERRRERERQDARVGG